MLINNNTSVEIYYNKVKDILLYISLVVINWTCKTLKFSVFDIDLLFNIILK